MALSPISLNVKGEVAESTVLSFFGKTVGCFEKVRWSILLDLPDVEIDKAHCEHVIRKERELMLFMPVAISSKKPVFAISACIL